MSTDAMQESVLTEAQKEVIAKQVQEIATAVVADTAEEIVRQRADKIVPQKAEEKVALEAALQVPKVVAMEAADVVPAMAHKAVSAAAPEAVDRERKLTGLQTPGVGRTNFRDLDEGQSMLPTSPDGSDKPGVQAFNELNALVDRRAALSDMIADKNTRIVEIREEMQRDMADVEKQIHAHMEEIDQMPAKAESLLARVDTRQDEVRERLGLDVPARVIPSS